MYIILFPATYLNIKLLSILWGFIEFWKLESTLCTTDPVKQTHSKGWGCGKYLKGKNESVQWTEEMYF